VHRAHADIAAGVSPLRKTTTMFVALAALVRAFVALVALFIVFIVRV